MFSKQRSITPQTDKDRFQSRAFLLLPMCFNVGVIIGPIMGGSLADPVHNFPHIFGKGSILGGEEGVWWMQNWPFALPNILSSIFIFMSFLAVFFGLDEVRIPSSMNYEKLTLDKDTRDHTTPLRLGKRSRAQNRSKNFSATT